MSTRKKKQVKQPDWFKGDIEFNVGNKNIKFSIVHNIPNSGNINSIDAALENWLMRTDDFTDKSFVDYINSKDVYKALTMEQFNKFLNS